MTDLDYAKVVGRFGLTVADGVDVDDNPDTIWCDEGTVEITPLITYTKVAGALPSPWTAGNAVITASINSSGYLEFNGKPYVYVVDLTSDKVNPQIGPNKATHRITFKNVKAGGTPVNFPSVTVRITAEGPDLDGINDLTELMPVDPGVSSPIYRGEQGTSIVDANITAGTNLSIELSDGTTLDAGELPVGPGGSNAGVAGYVANPGATRDAIDTYGNSDQKWLRADGIRRTVRSPGDGLAGYVDLALDMTSGYGLHLTAANASADSSSAVIGIGTDQGAAKGVYVSQKAAGSAVGIDQQPGASAVGISVDARSTQTAAVQYVVHPGNFGVFISGTNDKGYAGGQMTAGSAALYVPGADFTSDDIGKTIKQVAWSGTTTDQPGTIPTGTTITAVTDATHVTLSNNAVYTGTALQLLLVGRTPPSTQSLLSVFDESGGIVFKVRRRAVEVSQALSALATLSVGALLDSDVAFTVNHRATPTGSMAKIQANSDPFARFEVRNTGQSVSRYTSQVTNAGITTTPALQVQNFAGASDAAPAIRVIGSSTPGSGQSQIEFLDSSSLIQSRFNRDGYFMTRKTSAPADADIGTGELALWFDKTNGAAKLMVKAKQADGTVKTASVALA